ncbi:dienelactone hydrolase family protein [Frigidibacter sp. MR17.14]|uniref:dienelactone hydrolase family protein n=1 Tax=Frigidibacter sp. MR17.14 TaxID=3126509 RepID=UPI003012A48C
MRSPPRPPRFGLPFRAVRGKLAPRSTEVPMADVVLFHSILGPGPSEAALTRALTAAGHRVSAPDLFGGRSVQDYDAGFALKDAIGDAVILERARAALAAAPADAVLAGVSFGGFRIGALWQPETPAALLISGVAAWPEPPRPDLRLEAHVARPDPFDDEEFFADWAATCQGQAVLHRYDGAGHLFLDDRLPDYSAEAARLCLTRATAFLNSL